MLNEKEIKHFKFILKNENLRLEDNIKFFKSKGANLDNVCKEEQKKQESILAENKETIIKLNQMLKEIYNKK
ncbi:hypothetical protein [Clostridium beijerinckii]|uniref:hypothetical protein n=1 Tax=Clostridium beijerinckii TaxID=1520 RepID=UPI00098C3937|nr:hypothetical protein [Clostridium beijerinckii]NRT76331.1 hypothetical protein [Clostridium beijerinckii]OOM48632.1 hypothetical protein CBEIJ_21040 [Clostridium beijerinckii]